MSNEGFTPDAEKREYPHLHQDEMQVGDYLQWPQSALERLNDQYAHFVGDETSFPPHVERAQRILLHIRFELGCRAVEALSELDGGK